MGSIVRLLVVNRYADKAEARSFQCRQIIVAIEQLSETTGPLNQGGFDLARIFH